MKCNNDYKKINRQINNWKKKEENKGERKLILPNKKLKKKCLSEIKVQKEESQF
jgi:hypothetical protein